MSTQASTKKPVKKIEITIDTDPYEVGEKEMTVSELLALTGKDPSTHYLVEIKGKRERETYKDPHQAVKLHKGSEFVTAFTGSTPVS